METTLHVHRGPNSELEATLDILDVSFDRPRVRRCTKPAVIRATVAIDPFGMTCHRGETFISERAFGHASPAARPPLARKEIVEALLCTV